MERPTSRPEEPLRIGGSGLLLRAFQPEEIEDEWQAMLDADPIAIGKLPPQAQFTSRLQRSGRLVDGWLDLAVEVDGQAIGRIQTFVPPGRPTPTGVFHLGIGLRPAATGRGYGRAAVALLTGWLFEHADAERVLAATDPANTAMRRVFELNGWSLIGGLSDLGRRWVVYAISRDDPERSVPERMNQVTVVVRGTGA